MVKLIAVCGALDFDDLQPAIGILGFWERSSAFNGFRYLFRVQNFFVWSYLRIPLPLLAEQAEIVARVAALPGRIRALMPSTFEFLKTA